LPKYLNSTIGPLKIKKEVIREIISACNKYRDSIFSELEREERKQSVEVAKRLMNEEITLKQLLRSCADMQHGER